MPGDSSKSGGSRTYHKKSRNGCQQCKRIRKKCDERPPRCGGCERRNITCEYESMRLTPGLSPHNQDTSMPSPSHTPPPLSQSFTSHSSTPPVDTGSGYPNAHKSAMSFSTPQPVQDLTLLDHYQQYTFQTFSMLDNQDCRPVWEQIIPFQAHYHESLRLAVLAIAALHSAHMYPSEAANYASKAQIYHERAVRLFTSSAATTVTTSNATAALGFAFFQVIYRFASPFVPSPVGGVDILESFNDVMFVLSAFWRLLQQARPLITDEAVARMVSQEIFVPEYVPNETHSDLFDLLESGNELSFDSEEDKAAYKASAQELRRLYSIPFAPVTWSLILSWPIRSPNRIMTLLKDRRPLAMIHLAYWCVPIHYACSSPDQWFLNGWGERTILFIAQHIDVEFRPLVEWPLRQIGINAGLSRHGSASASDPSTSISPPHVGRRASDR